MSDISFASIGFADIAALSPELILVAFAVIVLGADLPRSGAGRKSLFWLSAIGVVLAAVACLSWAGEGEAFAGSFVRDGFTTALDLIFLLITLLTLFVSYGYVRREGIESGEYYGLVLLAGSGMLLLAGAGDMIVVFLGLEILSVASYVLAGLFRKNARSNEASLKYLLLGAMSTAFLLYGMAAVYGLTGATNLKAIGAALPEAASASPFLTYVGVGMMIVGFGFKVAAVPFHMWTPDVYEGAPTAVTAFFTSGPKAAAFAAALRVFVTGLGGVSEQWTGVIAVLAILSMTIGNIGAIAQKEIKRMLAYSSIAHAGYLLIGLAVPGVLGVSAIVFYLVAYTLMNLGAFSIVAALEKRGTNRTEMADYAGLAKRRPGMALAMTIFMVSLGGLPPTVGFVAKFYIFSAAVEQGMITLAVIGALNSLVSIFYYLRVTVIMYMRERSEPWPEIPVDWATRLVMFGSSAGTILLGVLPAWLWSEARLSALGFF
jgi:NADH-quinone oxidoreductase subunit N